ncbi:MAG: TRC40/GET3/ArsA family transport-energizing ATPase [Eubacteriales bacterium]|nr:ArsA family ATPase [Sarcina sp.]MDO4416682.1 TRC40/GET3/ArsA family transport-energizing ATPase [Eubacteriales bacterium]
MRILIYTGKGGVGKTSIAAATAVRIARTGRKVLLMSTDQAHSLGDSLCRNLGPEPQEIFPGLEALEIDQTRESRRAWGALQDYLRQLIARKAEGGIEADEVLLFPGLEELCSLIRILEAYEEDRHDVLVVDCAPTGETLSLLRYPEQLSVLADRLLPMIRGFTGVFGGLITRRTTVPKPRDLVFAEFDTLIRRLNALQKILRDRDITSMRIVTTPERIVLQEARRSFTWINQYDFGVDAVCINKIYPEEAMKGYFDGWREMQRESLQLAAESFPGRRHFFLLLQPEEIRGVPALEKAAQELYGKEDPAEIFCCAAAFREEYDPHSGIRTLAVSLPYAGPEEIRAEKEGDDLILYVRNEVRRLRLPDLFCRRSLSGWTLEDGELRLQFVNSYQKT